MNIGRFVAVGRNQHLVDKFNNLAGRLIQAPRVLFNFLFLFKIDIGDDFIQVFQSRFGSRSFSPGIKKVIDVFDDVFLEANAEVNSLVAHQGLDVICFAQIFRIVDEYLHALFVPTQRDPDVIHQKRFFEFVDQLERNGQLHVEIPERTSEIQRQGLADILFFYIETFNQHQFDAFFHFFGNRQGFLELIGGNEFISDEVIVTRT